MKIFKEIIEIIGGVLFLAFLIVPWVILCMMF